LSNSVQAFTGRWLPWQSGLGCKIRLRDVFVTRFQGGHIQNVVNLELGLPAGKHLLGEAKETIQNSREELLAEAGVGPTPVPHSI
jgi:hypothetical protein